MTYQQTLVEIAAAFARHREATKLRKGEARICRLECGDYVVSACDMYYDRTCRVMLSPAALDRLWVALRKSALGVCQVCAEPGRGEVSVSSEHERRVAVLSVRDKAGRLAVAIVEGEDLRQLIASCKEK